MSDDSLLKFMVYAMKAAPACENAALLLVKTGIGRG